MPSTTARLPVARLDAIAYRIPTDAPEADGTYAWTATTMIVVRVAAGGRAGLGYSYGDATCAALVRDTLAGAVIGSDAFDIGRTWLAMVRGCRNLGRAGIAACAVSAVDVALWDLKARLLDLPLVDLLGAERDAVPIYGSGGFTSYDDTRLCTQLAGWVEHEGCRAVKMKVGADPGRDEARARAAKAAIGDAARLYVDANGAYARKQALAFAEIFADIGATWFEEPVSSDDLEGLRLLRDRAPAGLEIAAGEYGYEPAYFRRMLAAEAVDVLQADATRCGGVTGFLRVAALADAQGLPLSAHTAPSLHLPVGCAAPRLRDIEWFHDHVRIERLLFDGVAAPRDGLISPDRSRPGLGLVLRQREAERFAL